MIDTLYINSVAQYSEELDVKSLVPDANVRRRMSQIVKMGVCAGQQCLSQVPDTQIDAIITATALGCTADSEKFLKPLVTAGTPSPTPFMQSTFNTIGSQLAILNNCQGENLTFVNRENSLRDALIASALLIEEGQTNILLVVADERTATVDKILMRLDIINASARKTPHWGLFLHDASEQLRDKFPAQAFALLVSAEKNDKTLFCLTDVKNINAHLASEQSACGQ